MTQRPRRGGDPRAAWLALPEGVQNGLERLVADNRELVRAMLEAGSDADESDLCCRCAGVMRQQNLSAAAFLARFFQADVLSSHAALLGKSSKGGAAALAERIGAAWAKNTSFQGESAGPDPTDEDGPLRKRPKKSAGTTNSAAAAPGNPPDEFVLKFRADGGSKRLVEAFPTAEALADRAWQLCEDNDLEMPSGDWTVDSLEWEPSCFDAMVIEESEEDWDPEGAFKGFVVEKLLGREAVKLSGCNGGAIQLLPALFTLKAEMGDGKTTTLCFGSSRALAEGAWKFCEEQGLEMPSAEWYTMVQRTDVVTGDTEMRETSCYDAMMTETGDADACFQDYVLRNVDTVNLLGGPMKFENEGKGGGVITLSKGRRC